MRGTLLTRGTVVCGGDPISDCTPACPCAGEHTAWQVFALPAQLLLLLLLLVPLLLTVLHLLSLLWLLAPPLLLLLLAKYPLLLPLYEVP